MQIDSTSQDELLSKVREAYSNASDNPGDSHPFPLGFDFAVSLGYPEELLQGLPGRTKSNSSRACLSLS